MTMIGGAIMLGACVGALASAARPCSAQALQYSYRAGDTVRFIETMDVNGISSGRGGTLAVELARVARIALAFTATDTVRAWYDSLAMSATGPTGPRRADTRGILRVPFVLRVRSDGHAKTLFTPALPDIVRQLAEFYPPFDDFLPMLPPGITGAAATRTDTIQRNETIGDRRVVLHRIVWSRIERDTMLAGQPSYAMSIRSTLRVEVATGNATTGFASNLVLEGIETGTAFVSRSGTLLQRSRSGEARGATTYKGRGAQVSVPQTYTYRSTIKAERQ